ncbi:hypothetical protein AAC387_Pa02g2277 [Persea americana]
MRPKSQRLYPLEHPKVRSSNRAFACSSELICFARSSNKAFVCAPEANCSAHSSPQRVRSSDRASAYTPRHHIPCPLEQPRFCLSSLATR